jgi:hypothetical protein
MSSFEFHDHNENEVIVSPVAAPEGPAVWLYARQGHTSTNVIIPLDRVEEVVAGLRDMARQAGGQTEPARCDNANCAGSCPGCYEAPAAVAGAPITAEQLARAREVLPDSAVITAAELRSCPSKHPALGRICGLPYDHNGMHTGAGAHGGAVWARTAGDAE